MIDDGDDDDDDDDECRYAVMVLGQKGMTEECSAHMLA